jgi:hypothetical protein
VNPAESDQPCGCLVVSSRIDALRLSSCSKTSASAGRPALYGLKLARTGARTGRPEESNATSDAPLDSSEKSPQTQDLRQHRAALGRTESPEAAGFLTHGALPAALPRRLHRFDSGNRLGFACNAAPTAGAGSASQLAVIVEKLCASTPCAEFSGSEPLDRYAQM